MKVILLWRGRVLSVSKMDRLSAANGRIPFARFSALLDYTTPDGVLAQLDKSNAKKEPDAAKLNLAALAKG